MKKILPVKSSILQIIKIFFSLKADPQDETTRNAGYKLFSTLINKALSLQRPCVQLCLHVKIPAVLKARVHYSKIRNFSHVVLENRKLTAYKITHHSQSLRYPVRVNNSIGRVSFFTGCILRTHFHTSVILNAWFLWVL